MRKVQAYIKHKNWKSTRKEQQGRKLTHQERNTPNTHTPLKTPETLKYRKPSQTLAHLISPERLTFGIPFDRKFQSLFCDFVSEFQLFHRRNPTVACPVQFLLYLDRHGVRIKSKNAKLQVTLTKNIYNKFRTATASVPKCEEQRSKNVCSSTSPLRMELFF